MVKLDALQPGSFIFNLAQLSAQVMVMQALVFVGVGGVQCSGGVGSLGRSGVVCVRSQNWSELCLLLIHLVFFLRSFTLRRRTKVSLEFCEGSSETVVQTFDSLHAFLFFFKSVAVQWWSLDGDRSSS